MHGASSTCLEPAIPPMGVISAAGLFLHIQFEHANWFGNWSGELQSHGEVAGYQKTYPKATPFLV